MSIECVVELGVISDGRRPILRIVNVRDSSSVCRYNYPVCQLSILVCEIDRSLIINRARLTQLSDGSDSLGTILRIEHYIAKIIFINILFFYFILLSVISSIFNKLLPSNYVSLIRHLKKNDLCLARKIVLQLLNV